MAEKKAEKTAKKSTSAKAATAAMNTSPIEAEVPLDEPSTRITESSLAPVLSATRTRV